MGKSLNDCIEMTILRHSPLFQPAPGYTLEQLQKISEEELNELTKLENILIEHQTSHRYSELHEFSHYCQSASDRLLFRLMSHSKPLKEFLSQSIYNDLWENRIEEQDLRKSMINTTSTFEQWENNFLTTHYKPWQNSHHANHSMAQSLKDKLALSHALLSSSNEPRTILAQ
ncbi:MAG: hypothetical protein CMF55_05530 [Legionellales bacterium]|nr:hypothetical protein [Legionellales bacterium]